MAEIGSIFLGMIEMVYLPSILDGDNWVMGDGLWKGLSTKMTIPLPKLGNPLRYMAIHVV
jgi:hypothetical protein